MKRTHVEADEKLCPGCAASLPLTSFGPNRARPPLYLQSRCRSCTNAAKGRKDAEKRKAAIAAKVSRDLAVIAAEVSSAEVDRYARVPLIGASGFAICPIAILMVPRTRGRWAPRALETGSREATQNWCDVLSSDARDHYRKAGTRMDRHRSAGDLAEALAGLEFD